MSGSFFLGIPKSMSVTGVVAQCDYTEIVPLVGVARDLFEIESGTEDIGLPPESYEASLSQTYWLNTWLKRDVKYTQNELTASVGGFLSTWE